jgi:lipopolysaccharide transport system permease protein
MSTAVMVGALGFLYSALFKMNLHEYLPFMAVSLVLWNFVSALVGEACTCFLSAEGTIRSMRLPFTLQAGRTVVRNVLVLAHNAVVIVVVFAIFRIWAGAGALLVLPGFALWLIDAIAACLLFGCFCARFRDIPPIVASIMQIAFFVSPIIWKPELVGKSAAWLPLNPFFSLLEIVRGPLLGTPISWTIWLSALGYSAALCAAAWLLFARVRGRIAFWV